MGEYMKRLLFLSFVFICCFSIGAYASSQGSGPAFSCYRMNTAGTAMIYGNCLGSPYTVSPSGAGIITQAGLNLTTQSGLNIVPQ